MSKGPAKKKQAELLREVLAAPSGRLPALLRERREFQPAGPWAEILRAEASRFYHTDAGAARSIALRALAVARHSQNPRALGWGYRCMAEASLFSGRMREAEDSYASAAQAWSRPGLEGLLGQLLVGRIHVLALLGRMSEVERMARKARRLLEAADDRAYLGKLAMNLGNLHFQQDRHDRALVEYERASGVFAGLHLRDEAVLGCEVNRAVALTQLDREEEALRLFGQLEQECTQRGFDLLRAQVWMNAAYVRAQQADFDLALADLGRATEYFRKTGHPAFLGNSLANRAEIYQQLNLHREALELVDEAIPLFASEMMFYDQALALSQSALCLLSLHEPQAAQERIRRARILFRKEENPSRSAVLSLLAAGGWALRHRRILAKTRATEALRVFRARGLIRWESMATVLLSRLTEADVSGRRDAVTPLQRILRRLPPERYPLTAYRVLEALGDAQARTGKPSLAGRSYLRAADALEDLRSRIPTEDSKIAFLGDKCDLFDRLLRLELARSRPSAQRLFEWMERSRAQALWDRLRSPSAYLEVGDDPELRSQRRHLSWLHARLSRLELASETAGKRAGAIARELRGAEAAWSQAWRQQGEAAGGRRVAPGRRPDLLRPALSIDQVAKDLPDGWGFLSYHVGPDFSLALAITSEGTAWIKLADDLGARLAELAERLDFQWSAAAMSSAAGGGPSPAQRLTTDQILAELARLLWRPLRAIGVDRKRRWIVSPHGMVHRIPLHALRDVGEYLVEQTDLVVTPSARIWHDIGGNADRAASTPVRKAWVAGLASRGLPSVRREVEIVARHLGGWDVTRSLAPDRESMRHAASASDLVHLATHGSLRRDNPMYSFVQLADGPLFVHDLAAFSLPGSTVVLTACSSGQGEAPSGDEWIGLARGFLQSGASSVVASLWPIQDKATLELMDLFYQGLAEDVAVATALGQAMRSLMDRRPHPWQWASFAVLGGTSGRTQLRARSMASKPLEPARIVSESPLGGN
jgi:tetratricopeptide (TPR) repeat protein